MRAASRIFTNSILTAPHSLGQNQNHSTKIMLVSEKIQIDDVTESGKLALFLVQTISDVSYYCKGRARYRPIDNRELLVVVLF